MAIAQDLANRIHNYPLPMVGFDPLVATERELENNGLPTRPLATQTEALAFWTRLMSPPLRFVQPDFSQETQTTPPLASPSTTFRERIVSAPKSQRTTSNRNRFEKSRNWSGLYLKCPKPDRFQTIGAAWTVANAAVPLVAPIDPWPGRPQRNEFRSSTWVGFNGYRAYPGVTMPQIGTAQQIKFVAGQVTPKYSAWLQWWSYDQDNPILTIDNLPIDAGHEVMAGLLVVSADEVIFVIKNQATGDFAWTRMEAPPNSEPLGTTAEWIVECPTTPGEFWPWRMPKLDEVNFSLCHALAGPRLIGPRSLHLLEHARFIRLQGRFLRMPGGRPDRYRSAIISVPERTGIASATVRYREG